MNKYFICIDADEDSGKSATLLCLIRMLEAQNFDKLDAFPHNEEEAKERFAKVVAAVRTILTDPTEKAKLEAEYKSQTKYGSLFGYAMHKLNGNYDENGDPIGG